MVTPPLLVVSEPEDFRFRSCNWATNTRLLCSVIGMQNVGAYTYAMTRLIAVDADGRNRRVLIQQSASAQGQFQDRVLNWNPGPPDTVLVEADEGQDASGNWLAPPSIVVGEVGTHGLPAVFELNIVTGRMFLREHARAPIRHWITDSAGRVRLGWGFDHAEVSYYARLANGNDWLRLAKFEVFSREQHFEPIAVSADDPNKAYAIASSEGRDALWLIDLTDKNPPALVFAHPRVDVTQPLLDREGHLLGVYYETSMPDIYYTDDRARSVIASVNKVLADKFNFIVSTSVDKSVYVIGSSSDLEPTSFSVFDTTTLRLKMVSDHQQWLDPTALARVRPMNYPARDGTSIPGYLTLPSGRASKRLPLIVMPHGGPIARDGWDYFFLLQFLASRGYAVLQMNFRGSGGYGDDWFFAAHQDWGGLTYDDVVDGTRWAIQQGIADPERICIVGWSFGGYIALVGGQRNSDLFSCAVSIAGISDLSLLIAESWGDPVTRKQIGTNSEKLKRDSPRLHAAEFKVPVLMVHGDHDAQVPLTQSQLMDSALRQAHKAERLVVIPNADHALSGKTFRVTLLSELQAFLAEHLDHPPGQTSQSSTVAK